MNAALLRLPGVREAVVVARSLESDARKLVAYVVVAGEERPLPEGLRAQLRGTLPDYMVPAAIVLLDALPRTPNGKIDFAALPEAPLDAVPPLRAHAPPADVLEQTLAAIWQEVLGVAHVSIRDNFFDLGGDSLLAIRMISAAARACGASVPIHQFLTEPTIEELAARLRAAADGGAGAPSMMLRLGRVPG